MRPIFLLGLFLLITGFAQAQTTASDTLFIPKHRFQIGLNMARALGGLIGNTTFTEDPYLLSFRFGGPRHRARFGLNYRVSTKEDHNFGSKLTLKENSFHFRGGIEWNFTLSRRWDMYWGIDGVLENSKSETTAVSIDNRSVLKSHQWGYGLGPVIGFAWRLSPRVSLSTECSLYAVAHRGKEDVQAFPDQTSQPIKDFSWQPLLPTSLFVNFSF